MRRVPDWAEEEEMVTILPHPASIMSGTTAWRQWNVPVRLTAIIRSQASALISRKSSNPSMPALVTMIPTGPNAVRTSSSVASMAARSLTSTAAPSALPPSAATSSATAPAASPLMSSTATLFPGRARWWQMARPMPEPPPVTTATRLTCDSRLPCRRSSFVSPSDPVEAAHPTVSPAGPKRCR